MPERLRPGLFSLQTKLVITMTSLILLGVLATGAVFVLRSRGDHQQQALERVAASAPAIYQTAPAFDVMVGAAGQPVGIERFIDQTASKRGLRILLVGDTGEVVHDSGGLLQGTMVDYPAAQLSDVERGFVAWEPGSAAANFTFVASAAEPFGTDGPRPRPFVIPLSAESAPGQFGIILGVETAKLENAWLSALPGLGIAAGIVTPFAVVLAIVLARQIARPVHQLTVASEAMARGDFDQRVEVGREDEMGRLAKAFSVMAERVGERDAQMRALLANVSHDLKTPMTSIIGYAQALRDGVADDTQQTAAVIHRQANLAHELLADLLFLSEIDSGQSVRVQEQAPAAEIAARAVNRIRPAAEAKGVAIEVSADEAARCGGIDVERVVRALTNVIDNAVRFSAAGDAVRVSAAPVGGSVRFEVANRGPGIAPDDLPHIFERFYRGQNQGGGHGLGLAIAREAIELNGGSIGAENTADGVKVTLDLPAG